MTEIVTLTYGAHVAHLVPLTGDGVLVIPRSADNVSIGTGVSLHEADWNHMIRDLLSRGWCPSEDETGDLAHVGTDPLGRTVVGLYGEHPIISEPSVPESAAAFADLMTLAGIVA